MKKNLKKEGELISLNEKLFSDFSVEELEKRLETDPLLNMSALCGNAFHQSCGALEGYMPCDAVYTPCGVNYELSQKPCDSEFGEPLEPCGSEFSTCGISYILEG